MTTIAWFSYLMILSGCYPRPACYQSPTVVDVSIGNLMKQPTDGLIIAVQHYYPFFQFFSILIKGYVFVDYLPLFSHQEVNVGRMLGVGLA